MPRSVSTSTCAVPVSGVFGFEAELRKVIASRCKDHVPEELITRVADALREEHSRQAN